MNVEQGADEYENHLVIHFFDVIPDAEDDSAHFPCDRDGVLGIVHAVDLRLAVSDELPVDDTGLDLVAKADKEA